MIDACPCAAKILKNKFEKLSAAKPQKQFATGYFCPKHAFFGENKK